jgi:acyl-CoA thioesterase-1
VIETGANDGLRGQDPDSLRANIQAIVDRARAQQPPPTIVLVGMEAPPNYGEPYARRFRAVYPEMAAANHLPLVPFLLAGVAGHAELNQADGVHPTPEGHERIADTMFKVLQPILTPR